MEGDRERVKIMKTFMVQIFYLLLLNIWKKHLRMGIEPLGKTLLLRILPLFHLFQVVLDHPSFPLNQNDLWLQFDPSNQLNFLCKLNKLLQLTGFPILPNFPSLP